MRSLLLALAAVSAAALPAQVHPRSSTSQRSITTCTVSGQVVTATEGNPLKSAFIILSPDHLTPSAEDYAAVSDADGRFTLTNVLPGRYDFSAMRTGYVTQKYGSNAADSGALLALQPGQHITDVLFRMTRAAVITGHVQDEDGEPMANIQVSVLRAPSKDEIEEAGPYASRRRDLIEMAAAATDDRGQYRIFGLKPGDYYVRGMESFRPFNHMVAREQFVARRALGTSYAPVYYPGVLQLSQAQLVSVSPGEEQQIDFTMRHVKTVEVSGRVVSADGKPANAMVELQQPGIRAYDPGHSSETDDDGKFTLKGVPPGSYILLALQSSDENVYTQRLSRKIEVGSDNLESLVLNLGRGTTLRGQVTLEGPTSSLQLDRVYVNLLPVDTDDRWGANTTAKKDGSFELKGVTDGDYAIAAFVNDKDTWYVKSVHLGTTDILAEGLHLEGGSSETIEIVLSSAGAQLEGSVTENDKPVAGAHIRLAPEPETRYNDIRHSGAITDQYGRFVISSLSPGRYRISARSIAPDGTRLVSDAQIITLSERDHKSTQLLIPPPQQN